MACGQKLLWIHGRHGGHESSDFKRNFLGSLRLEILEEIFVKIWPGARNYSSSITYNL